MSTKIKTKVREVNGEATYDVLLSAVPRQGEKLSLFSHLDQSNKKAAMHTYEVISVNHVVHDVTDKVESSKVGHHEVTLMVIRI